MVNATVLKLDKLVCGYKGKALLEAEAEFFLGFNLVMGRSGSGKTTLLKTIESIIPPLSGAVIFDGVDVRSIKTWSGRCILLPQKGYYLADSVYESIRIPFYLKAHRKKKMDEDLMRRLLDMFGLGVDVLSKSSSELSGGEMQRVAIIRNLLLKPYVALFDEPTSALDEHTARAVFEYLGVFCRDRVCVIVSHETIARDFADRLYVIEDGRLWLNQ
ncbi:ABC transporter ATP-binding protein [Hippea sp. KM1]|uniref:ABC transporter ATP-binding protein n=1 Tax=Hippea sp. KM1 TaxID=944481 RepID=UPI00046C8F70|nr:ATP-binding cassette domain-containing protein [Hippea sp. KM1]